MLDAPPIASIAHVIQLAVAPVFLLSGIAAILNVLGIRLSRIVDRARVLEGQFATTPPERIETLRTSLQRMAVRARLVSWSISLCTSSAILVSSVVIVLFIGSLVGINVRVFIAILFIAAMVTLTVGLIFFLREVHLATRHLRIGEPEPERSPPALAIPLPRHER